MVMKFRAHDTFFIRKGWLSKGMKYVHAKDDVFISKNENPMDVLGIGANMVKALRYWLQAVGLTEEPSSGRRTQSLHLSEKSFLPTTDTSKKKAHYICFSIVLPAIAQMQHHGTSSLMSSI